MIIDSHTGLKISLFSTKSDILRTLKIGDHHIKGKKLERASRVSGLQLNDYNTDQVQMVRIISDRWKLERRTVPGRRGE